MTFAGVVLENTFTSAHTSVAFIKDFAPDFSSFNTITVPTMIQAVQNNNFTTNGYAWNWLGLTGPHDVTGGPTGINNVDRFRVFGHVLSNAPTDYVFVSAAGITVVAILFHYVNRSRTGRAWRALREDPLAAEMMGIPVKWLSLLAVAVGAGVAGFAGSVNGAYYQGVFPDTFTFPLLITVYAMVILGGAGSLGASQPSAASQSPPPAWTPDADEQFILDVNIHQLQLGDTVRAYNPRLLAALIAGLAIFGVVVHEIVGAVWARGVGGPIAVGPTSFTTHGFLATVIRHWMVLPKGTYTAENFRIGNYAFVIVIALVLACTVIKGWKRWALLVPTIWGACFVWETLLVEQAPTTRPLFLGVILIVLMATRPAGLFEG